MITKSASRPFVVTYSDGSFKTIKHYPLANVYEIPVIKAGICIGHITIDLSDYYGSDGKNNSEPSSKDINVFATIDSYMLSAINNISNNNQLSICELIMIVQNQYTLDTSLINSQRQSLKNISFPIMHPKDFYGCIYFN